MPPHVPAAARVCCPYCNRTIAGRSDGDGLRLVTHRRQVGALQRDLAMCSGSDQVLVRDTHGRWVIDRERRA